MPEQHNQLVEVKTIGEVEHIVHASGEWDGTDPVEFSNDGETWTEAWAPTDDHPQPTFARVTVYRKGLGRGTRKTIRWDEHVPTTDEFWLAKWFKSPTRHFGRVARMIAFRETFRDLLGNIVIEEEDRATASAAPQPAPTPVERDWMAEFDAADTAEALDAAVADARKARVFTPDLQGTTLDRYWKTRRRELAAAAADVEPAPERHSAPRPRPTDRQAPKSTATKRKRARRKGGRR